MRTLQHQTHYLRTLRARPDLKIVVQQGSGDRRHVVKDPVSLDYFHLGDREAFLLEQLQTPRTLEELKRAYDLAFAPQQVSHAALLGLCAGLQQHGLLLPSASTVPAPKKPADRRAWDIAPLVIRAPGIDPTPVLDRLRWLGTLAFSGVGALFAALAAGFVLTFLLGRLDELFGEASQVERLWSPRYAVCAALVLIALKAWHELGHGLACRRFGGECHDMGVMLLAFCPCLYCDVSDSWTFPSRWRRAAVALAGVYFELLAAIAAMALWLMLTPGPARTLCLMTAAAASVTTLLVNLNPLLRMDGYYLLADLWGTPNLHQQARCALWEPVTRWIRGGRSPLTPVDGSRTLLACYAVCSTLQSAALLVLVVWGLRVCLSKVGLAAVGDLLTLAVAATVLLGLGRMAMRLFPGIPDGRTPLRLARFAAVLSLALAALGLGLMIPIEQSLWAPCRFELVAQATVAAPETGLLTPRVAYGQRVEAGDLIALLEAPELRLQQIELQGQIAQSVAELRGLRTLAQRDASLFPKVQAIETRRDSLLRQRETIDSQIAELRVVAPRGGVVLEPGPRQKPDESSGELPAWSGSPLDPANAGACIERGQPLCLIGDGAPRAVLLLDEGDSGLVAPGDPVRILADRAPWKLIEGAVSEIGLNAAEELEEAKTTQEQADAQLRGALERGRAFRVHADLGTAEALPQHGALGRARVVTGRESLGGLALRTLQQLVVFEPM